VAERGSPRGRLLGRLQFVMLDAQDEGVDEVVFGLAFLPRLVANVGCVGVRFVDVRKKKGGCRWG
jgi:hypothetical protein